MLLDVVRMPPIQINSRARQKTLVKTVLKSKNEEILERIDDMIFRGQNMFVINHVDC